MVEYYFIDTRENAKSAEPFAIYNADVAKVWAREYNNGEGPFQPVNDDKFGINRHDLKTAGENTSEKQEEAAKHNTELVFENPYKDMTKAELIDELDARGIEYKKNGSESTNDFYIKQLLADDDQ
jgi:hypothetical protein